MCGNEVRDSKAVEIAETMMGTMGGKQAWMRARFVRFDFRVTAGGKEVARRAHLWDKPLGRYRLEGKNKEGKSTLALFNVADQTGKAYVDGKELQGAGEAKALKDAYATFINDMYWLAMPWKWLDEGVNLKYAGQRKLGPTSYDIVELTFGRVGLTPGDRYRAFVSPRSHMMEHWEYTLQSGNKGSWDWSYITTGGVSLARKHTSADGKVIDMGEVQVTDRVDESLFKDPGKELGKLE